MSRCSERSAFLIHDLELYPKLMQGLDMTEFVRGPDNGTDHGHVYDCVAVSNHTGTLEAGHYTAFCRHERTLGSGFPEDSRHCWCKYDDNKVPIMVSSDEVVTPEAYVLFYRRRSCSRQARRT